jgi:hypothetical protein
LKPTIIRLHEDHFDIVVVAAIPQKNQQTRYRNFQWPELLESVPFTRDFLVVWDWEHSLGDAGKCDAWIRTTKCQWAHPETVLGNRLDNATRIWDVALILGDLGHTEKAGKLLQQAVKGYKMVLGDKHQQIPESQIGLIPLSWAAQNGHVVVVKLLLSTGKVNVNSKDSEGRRALSWPAQNGHTAVVKLLLNTSKIEVNSEDLHGRTLLSYAAAGGHLAVVEWLLEEKAEVSAAAADMGRTALQAAVEGGHFAVVKRLKQAGAIG